MYRSLVLLGSCLCDGRVGILLTPLLILLPAAPPHPWHLGALGLGLLCSRPLSSSSSWGTWPHPFRPQPGPASSVLWLEVGCSPPSPSCSHHSLGVMPPDLNLSPFSLFKSEKAYGHPSQPGGYRNLGEGDKPACFPLFERILLSESGVSDHDDIWALPPAIAGF